MTTNNNTVRPPFVLPHASAPCYVIAPGAKADDMHDLLNTKLLQLGAMLKATYADAGEAFRALNDTTQDNFMWGCSNLADECQMLLEQTAAKYEVAAVPVRHGELIGAIE